MNAIKEWINSIGYVWNDLREAGAGHIRTFGIRLTKTSPFVWLVIDSSGEQETKEDIAKKACAEIWESYHRYPWFKATGIQTFGSVSRVIIYVEEMTSEAKWIEHLGHWNGVPVGVVLSGRIEAC